MFCTLFSANKLFSYFSFLLFTLSLTLYCFLYCHGPLSLMCLCRVSSLVLSGPVLIWLSCLPLLPLHGLAGMHLHGAPLSTCGQPVSWSVRSVPPQVNAFFCLGSPTRRAACLHLQAAGQSLCRP